MLLPPCPSMPPPKPGVTWQSPPQAFEQRMAPLPHQQCNMQQRSSRRGGRFQGNDRCPQGKDGAGGLCRPCCPTVCSSPPEWLGPGFGHLSQTHRATWEERVESPWVLATMLNGYKLHATPPRLQGCLGHHHCRPPEKGGSLAGDLPTLGKETGVCPIQGTSTAGDTQAGGLRGGKLSSH